jgi:peptidoglycan/xylan/chitin deacetylase (PgdA/CDA1 family)
MKSSRMSFIAGLGVAFGIGVLGCEPLPRKSLVNAMLDPGATMQRHLAAISQPTPTPPKRVTDRKPNLTGRTLILEYHKLSRKNTDLDRTPAKFRQDLQTLYDLGYRPVTVTEWLDGNMHLPPGASPVILTFDDAHPSQFKFKKDGSIDPNCFVAIWQQFAAKHPDFPVHGTFFILPPWPFGQAKHLKDKVAMLREMGSEVACHTWHHFNLTSLSDEQVKEEIGSALEWLEKDFGVTNTTLAYPYGNKPKNMDLVRGFVWNGKPYKVRCAFVAAGNPSEQPNAKDFDPWSIPRVLAGDRANESTSWLKVMKTSKRFPPYVAP